MTRNIVAASLKFRRFPATGGAPHDFVVPNFAQSPSSLARSPM